MSQLHEPSALEAKRNSVIKALYELTRPNTLLPANVYELEAKSNVDSDYYPILRYLQDKKLLRKSNLTVFITVQGIEEAERMIEADTVNWRYQVLRKIYDIAGGRMTEMVVIEKLVKELGANYRDVNEALLYLERKDLLKGMQDSVNLTDSGLDEIEQTQRHPERGTPNFPPYIVNNYHINNYGTVGGIQQGGESNTQNVTFTNNPEFNAAISELLKLVQSAQAPAETKEGLTEDIQAVNNLATKQPAPGLLERVKGKLDAIKIAITTTDIAFKAMPQIEKLYAHFERWLGQ